MGTLFSQFGFFDNRIQSFHALFDGRGILPRKGNCHQPEHHLTDEKAIPE